MPAEDAPLSLRAGQIGLRGGLSPRNSRITHSEPAPGDDVGARHAAEFLQPDEAGEAHEVGHRGIVGAPGLRIGQVGEPLHRRRTPDERGGMPPRSLAQN